MSVRIVEPWMSDPRTLAVTAALQAAGGAEAARFVGGCVRDAIVGRAVSDIDIATPLTPPEVMQALKAAGLRAVPTGVEHGTVTAIAEHKPFEITTLRRDVETDGRRAVVAFTTDWAEDAARRDFRLNALYLDPQGRLFDPTGGGLEDAKAGRIVFVGDAGTRIREDYLRVLRFFRFFAWFGREAPDAEALGACRELAAGVAGLSGERLQKELLKLLAAPAPVEAVRLMVETGVSAVFLPEPLDLARFEAMAAIDTDPELRLAALLPRDGAAVARTCERLRLSRVQAGRLAAAVAPGPELYASEAEARRALYADGAEAFADRVLLRWAEQPDAVVEARRMLALARAWSRPVFPLGGEDAKALGVPAGRELGALLRDAEAWWVEQDFTPDRAAMLDWLKVRVAKGRA